MLLNGVQREGMPDLIKYMEDMNFFTCPASIGKHMGIKHGLLIHCYRLFQIFHESNQRTGKIPFESVIICAFCHDLCKANAYLEKSDGSWVYNPAKEFDGRHATLSIERIERFIELTDDEYNIIKYHMGFFYSHEFAEKVSEYSCKDMHLAIKECISVQVFAACDMEVSRWNHKQPYWNSDKWRAVIQSHGLEQIDFEVNPNDKPKTTTPVSNVSKTPKVSLRPVRKV